MTVPPWFIAAWFWARIIAMHAVELSAALGIGYAVEEVTHRLWPGLVTVGVVGLWCAPGWARRRQRVLVRLRTLQKAAGVR